MTEKLTITGSKSTETDAMEVTLSDKSTAYQIGKRIYSKAEHGNLVQTGIVGEDGTIEEVKNDRQQEDPDSSGKKD